MFTIHRRKSDYWRIGLMTIVLILQLLIFCVVQLRAQNGTQQLFNGRIETRVEQLEKAQQNTEGLKLESRLTRLESQAETMNWLLTTVVGGVAALLTSHIWQIVTASRARRK